MGEDRELILFFLGRHTGQDDELFVKTKDASSYPVMCWNTDPECLHSSPPGSLRMQVPAGVIH